MAVAPIPLDQLSTWALSTLLISMRVAPVFAFAPPFTLVSIPPTFRVMFALVMAGCLANSATSPLVDPSGVSLAPLVAAAFQELLVGAIFVTAFQIAYAGLSFAGRALDIQVGFGLAGLIDPTTNAQAPLIGTVFAYAAAIVFFALNGHHGLLELLSTSLTVVPLGSATLQLTLERLTGFMSAVFIASFGAAGAAMLTLFLADLAIAMLSRTAPQMNVLATGLQVKVLLLLVVLPVSIGATGAVFVRLATLTLAAIPRLLGHG